MMNTIEKELVNVFDEINMIGEMIENDEKLNASFDEFVESGLYEKAANEGRLMEYLNEGRKPITSKFTFQKYEED